LEAKKIAEKSNANVVLTKRGCKIFQISLKGKNESGEKIN
jgi:hypothetical protein